MFVREYPRGRLFAHPIGYSFIQNGRRGLEQSRNDELAGKENEFESIFAGLEGRDSEGNDVVTNLDVDGTERRRGGPGRPQGRRGGDRAADRQGARDGVDPRVRPQPDPDRLQALNTDPDKPTFNRTTQELYPPGSTFKVVTATAALDTGKVTPETIIDGSSPKEISGVPLENSGGQSFGPISLHGRAHQLRQHRLRPGRRAASGRGTLVEYMKRFGFYEDPQLDYPDNQMIPSGVRRNGERSYVRGRLRRRARGDRPGRLEGAIEATPLQMAEVAAAIAQQGPADEAAPDRPRRAQGRAREGAHRARPPVRGDEARDRRAADRDDGPRGRGGHRHRRGAGRASAWRARPAPPRSAPTASSPSPGSSASRRSTTRAWRWP